MALLSGGGTFGFEEVRYTEGVECPEHMLASGDLLLTAADRRKLMIDGR